MPRHEKKVIRMHMADWKEVTCLYKTNIIHQDLKMCHVLVIVELVSFVKTCYYLFIYYLCLKILNLKLSCKYFTTNFESVVGIIGIGFGGHGRSYSLLKKRGILLGKHLQLDIYNYAMTCSGIIIGCIPFGN